MGATGSVVAGELVSRGRVRRVAVKLIVDDAGESTKHAMATLAALHGAGIVVCDIKPANILLDELGAPVFADFGAAVVIGGNARHAKTFQMRALPGSDVWSLACTLVEMHTGRAPWEGMCAQQINVAVLFCGRVPAVPDTMPACDVIRRCFSFDPRDRPTAADLAAAMRE